MRLLIAVEDAITSAARDAQGRRRTVSTELVFVEISADGTARDAGCAPYLDYRAVQREEQPAVKRVLSEASRLQGDLIERYPHRSAMREDLERTRVVLVRGDWQITGLDEWDEDDMSE